MSAIAARTRHVADLAPAFGVYVHVPFCVARCPYCDFNTYVGMDDLAPAYFEAMLREAEAWAARQPLLEAGTVFFGGGTPTLPEPTLVASFLTRLRGVIAIEPDAEITIEANPESATAERLGVLREAGANRVSIGAQSFSDRVLRMLGRWHDAATTKNAVAAARSAGFANLNLDLIYGMPGETDDDWARSLDETIALEPDHVSCYALTIEGATQFGADVAGGRMPAPDEDVQAARYETALDALHTAGYAHYELSNWGLPARHNLVYWTQGEYIGLGAGAHSHLDGVRSWNRKNPRTYVDDPTRAREGEERLGGAAREAEWLQLRLRLIDGVDLREAEQRLGRELHIAAGYLQENGLVAVDGERLRLTRRGMLLENQVAIRLTG